MSTIVDNENFSGYTPDIDGQVLTQSIGPALASGQFAHVPVIIGTNHDEWRLFVAISTLEGAPVTAANCQAMISATLGVPARGRAEGDLEPARPGPSRPAGRPKVRPARDLRLCARTAGR